jgi:transposase
MSGKSRRYPAELKERAVRMVLEHQDEYPSQWRAICSIGEQLGVHHESLRVWVRRAETDAGFRPGLTTDERARLKELERENRELKRANEILKSASVFFATELDGRTKK